MPFSNPQTLANPDLTDFSTPTTLDGVSSGLDRTILGIPRDDDEYTRGMNAFFNPSSGQPSVHSTSEEYEGLKNTPPYEPSHSSNSSGSYHMLTPESVCETSVGIHPRAVPLRFVESFQGQQCDDDAHRSNLSFASARATAGTNITTRSPVTVHTPTHMSMEGFCSANAMLPAVDSLVFRFANPPEDMNDPQSIIRIDSNDIMNLEEIMSHDLSFQVDTVVPESDLLDAVDDQTSQSTAPPQSDTIQGSKRKHEEVDRKVERRKRPAAKLPHCIPRLQHDTTEAQGTFGDATDKAARTKLMRKLGVCLPCLVNHEPCAPEVPGEPCPTCLKAKIPKTPCVRPHLSSAKLFRTGALSFPNGPPVMREWVSKDNVSLSLYNIGPASMSVSPQSRPRFLVTCRQFPDTPGIRSVKSWTKGSDKIDIHLPNFAMTYHQCSEAGKRLDELVEAQYNKLVAELAVGQDDIVSMTLAEAIRQAEKCEPIKGALRLCILSRLASKSFNITGQETLGIRQEQDPACPYYSRIPIPPLLDAQIDFLLIQKMNYWRRYVLSRLRIMITGDGRKHWLKIYLIILVLLFNLESVYQNQLRQIKRYQEPTRQQQSLLEFWEHAAHNLTDHYRAVCRGNLPFTMNWSKEDQYAAEVDDTSLEFIDCVKEKVGCRAHELEGKTNAPPETPLVWVSALFAS